MTVNELKELLEYCRGEAIVMIGNPSPGQELQPEEVRPKLDGHGEERFVYFG